MQGRDRAGGGEAERVRAAQAGDREALGELLSEHYDAVHALCRRITGNDADALDATQDALLAAVRAIGRFDGRSAFGTWLYRIATNACLDELRRRRRRPLTGLGRGLEGEEGWDGAMGGTPAWGSAGADPADRVADRLDVDSALAQLTPDFRVAVVLRDLSGLGYDEIAAVLEVPVGTVRSRISRGRAALAGLLADRDGNPTGPAGVEPGGGREEPSASD